MRVKMRLHIDIGILKKGKRKIVVNGGEYYWSIKDDFELIDSDTVKPLTVITDNKKFLVEYPVNQNGNCEDLIVVIGKTFGGAGKWANTWHIVKCPKWETDGKITPVSVENLIRWSLSEKTNEFLDYRGKKTE